MQNELEKLAREEEELVSQVMKEHRKEITGWLLTSFLITVFPGMLIGSILGSINILLGLLAAFTHLTVVRLCFTGPKSRALNKKILDEVHRRRVLLVAREQELNKGLNNVEQGKVNRDSNE
jgi:cell division protein FtsL